MEMATRAVTGWRLDSLEDLHVYLYLHETMQTWLMGEQESSVAGYLRYWVNNKYGTRAYTSSV
jgi:hypothetical protein